MIDEIKGDLLVARNALEKVLDKLEDADDDDFEEPGRMYLIGKLETALYTIESEFPEFEEWLRLRLQNAAEGS